MKIELVIIAHNIRSTHNVGALLRTAEGLGIDDVILTGYTPYPSTANDTRLPHISAKIDKQIQKTALGAQDTQHWHYSEDINEVLTNLRKDGFVVAGLEQTPNSMLLNEFKPPKKLALLLGSEVEGISQELIKATDLCLEIPMYGKKESFNVIEATSMAMYHCRFMV